MTLIFVLMTLLIFSAPAGAASAKLDQPANHPAKDWFQSTEQALMDSIATGDKAVWDRVLDENCIYTSEEGQSYTKQEFLKELTGLPPGLSGSIKVEELTVQEYPTFAVVRFLANEQENVFGQQLMTKYKVTDTFRKAGKEWKLLASHLSVVTADPPAQEVSTENWSRLPGVYRLMPEGWKLHVVLRDGSLSAGRDPNNLRPLIPLAPSVFVRKGALGELIFVVDKDGKASRIVEFRKFEPLIWTRVGDAE